MLESEPTQMTFLFTDIEGSTRLWEMFPAAMTSALARHDAILREQIVFHGGLVFKTVGDAFCAAFSDPQQAVATSVAIQRGLNQEIWGETGSLRVRIALHCGEPSQRENDFFGPPVNGVARLLAAGHGGQILVSDAVRSSLGEWAPDSIELTDLGVHRLRDVLQPMRIFQLAGNDLPNDFAPLKTLDYDPHNIPAQLTSFIGRSQEIENVLRVLRRPDTRLLTLTGPGGVGKTRLALRIATTMRDDFPDGRYVVSLASLIDPAAVVDTIARELKVPEGADSGDTERIVTFLREKHMLLVLDNFEHVLAASDVVVQLLAQCPHLTLLVTSRIGLRIYGEQEYAVTPFQVPDRHLNADFTQIAANEAVVLYLDRARSVRSGFELSEQNAGTVAEICVRLDGLPLAIELAAARSKMLSPQAILNRLAERLTFLQGQTRGVPERQQTIRATIRWSYDLLVPAEQALFRWLTVFAGGFTLESAEQVVALFQDTSGYSRETLVPDVQDGIAILIDNSLIQLQETAIGEPRLLILETLREFGHECMQLSSEMEAMQREHAAWCTELALEARQAYTRSDEGDWLDRLESEHDNLRAALTWLGNYSGNQALSQTRLAANLWWYWLYRRYLGEGREWLTQALTGTGAAASGDRADALNGAGVLAHMQADNRAAVTYLRESLELRRVSGSAKDLASVLNNLGNVKRTLGDFGKAVGYFEEAVAVAREGGELRILGTMLSNLGNIYYATGDYDRAIRTHREALTVQEKQGHQRGATTTRGNLADTFQAFGRLAEAKLLYIKVAADFSSMEDDRSAAQAWLELGNIAWMEADLALATWYVNKAVPEFENDGALDSLSSAKVLEAKIAIARGDLVAARSLLLAQIEPAIEMDEDERVILLIEWLARIALASGQPETAARWFGATEALRQERGIRMMPVELPEWEETQRTIRSTLGEVACDKVRQVGAALSLEDCLAETRQYGI